MHEPGSPQDSTDIPETAPGELDQLLREIEKEAVPERLLELAQQLQEALVKQRTRVRLSPARDRARSR